MKRITHLILEPSDIPILKSGATIDLGKDLILSYERLIGRPAKVLNGVDATEQARLEANRAYGRAWREKQKQQKQVELEWPCGRCEAVFDTRQGRGVHIARVHGKNWVSTPKVKQLEHKATHRTTCATCRKTFATWQGLAAHSAIHKREAQ